MAERGHRTPAWIPFKGPIFPVGPIIRGGLARATLGGRRADLMASLLDADDQGPRDRAQIGAALLVVSVVALLVASFSPLAEGYVPLAWVAGALGLGVASVVWILPWARWPSNTGRWTVSAALLAVVLAGLLAGADPTGHAIMLILASAWVGVAYPRGQGLRIAPSFSLLYLVPFIATGRHLPEASAVVYVGPACAGVCEILAWVTERRRHQQELAWRTIERQLHVLMRKASDIILVLDRQGAILYESPTIRALGYQPGTHVGISVLDLVHPEDCHLAEQLLAGLDSAEYELEVCELLEESWRRKAPKRLAAARDSRGEV